MYAGRMLEVTESTGTLSTAPTSIRTWLVRFSKQHDIDEGIVKALFLGQGVIVVVTGIIILAGNAATRRLNCREDRYILDTLYYLPILPFRTGKGKVTHLQVSHRYIPLQTENMDILQVKFHL
jgi:hypothetical protein